MSSIATLAPFLLQGALGLGKAIAGGVQLRKNKRPSPVRYEIPSGFMDYLTRSDIMARQGLPGEDIIRGQIGSQVSGAVSDISRSYDTAVGAGGATRDVYMKSIDAIRDLGIRSAEYTAQMQQRAADARKDYAMYQDKAWEYNENIPYQRAMNEYWGQKQAGMSNLWGGLDTMASSAVSGFTTWNQDNQMKELINAVKGVNAT